MCAQITPFTLNVWQADVPEHGADVRELGLHSARDRPVAACTSRLKSALMYGWPASSARSMVKYAAIVG
jgi:hypothetical protein